MAHSSHIYHLCIFATLLEFDDDAWLTRYSMVMGAPMHMYACCVDMEYLISIAAYHDPAAIWRASSPNITHVAHELLPEAEVRFSFISLSSSPTRKL